MKSPFLSDARVTQEFGANPSYYKPYGLHGHEGIDLVPTLSTWGVHAIADGEVILDDDKATNRAYGNQVRLKARDGRVWAYCHLSENCVRLGDKVKEGDLLGIMGNTGTGTGPHLHLMTYREDSGGNRLYLDNGYKGMQNPRGYL
jgi:murein DD-endopeptidase MepM/ murein hydrolase activator NlpD